MGNDCWKHEMHLCIYILTCWGTDLLSRGEFDEKSIQRLGQYARLLLVTITLVDRWFSGLNTNKKKMESLLTGLFWVFLNQSVKLSALSNLNSWLSSKS